MSNRQGANAHAVDRSAAGSGSMVGRELEPVPHDAHQRRLVLGALAHADQHVGHGTLLVVEHRNPVVESRRIRLAAEKGCEGFDMLRGDEPYKYRFGAVDVPLIELKVDRA